MRGTIALFLMIISGSALPQEDLTELYSNLKPSVVTIMTRNTDHTRGAIGSGVVIDVDGHIMTAAHVVHAADEIMVKFADGQNVPAKTVISNTVADLALLQLSRIPAGGGLLVQHVAKNSMAGHAGLRAGTMVTELFNRDFILGGDIILSIYGASCTAPHDFTRIRQDLEQLRDGEPFVIEVLRAGKRLELHGLVDRVAWRSLLSSDSTDTTGFSTKTSPASAIAIDAL